MTLEIPVGASLLAKALSKKTNYLPWNSASRLAMNAAIPSF